MATKIICDRCDCDITKAAQAKRGLIVQVSDGGIRAALDLGPLDICEGCARDLCGAITAWQQKLASVIHPPQDVAKGR